MAEMQARANTTAARYATSTEAARYVGRSRAWLLEHLAPRLHEVRIRGERMYNLYEIDHLMRALRPPRRSRRRPRKRQPSAVMVARAARARRGVGDMGERGRAIQGAEASALIQTAGARVAVPGHKESVLYDDLPLGAEIIGPVLTYNDGRESVFLLSVHHTFWKSAFQDSVVGDRPTPGHVLVGRNNDHYRNGVLVNYGTRACRRDPCHSC